MNVPLVAAGGLALVATAIHGAAGEVLVVRRLSLEGLPPTRFGGPRTTKTMIHVCWHLTTAAFLSVAVALVAAGSFLDGDAAHAIGIAAAAAAAGFAAVTVAIGAAYARSPRFLRHPAGAVLTATAVLAWWGAL